MSFVASEAAKGRGNITIGKHVVVLCKPLTHPTLKPINNQERRVDKWLGVNRRKILITMKTKTVAFLNAGCNYLETLHAYLEIAFFVERSEIKL